MTNRPTAPIPRLAGIVLECGRFSGACSVSGGGCKMQFSLKDLLLVMAFCAGIAWCLVRVGIDNGWFWFDFTVAGIMSVLFVFIANQRPRAALWVTIPVLVFSVMFFWGGCLFPALFLDGLILTIAAFAFAPSEPPSIRKLSTLVAIAGLVSAVAGALPGWAWANAIEEAKKESPVVSLETRLSYERRGQSVEHVRELGRAVSKGLEMMDDSGRSSRREELALLHDHNVELFVRAQGFGIVRMATPMLEYVRRPQLRDIQFNEVTPFYREPAVGYWSAFVKTDRSKDVKTLHLCAETDFLDPDGFGYVMEPIEKVAGFIAHAFHYSPKSAFEKPDAWTIERLELVSLLKFDTPRVYVLDHLPWMDQLNSDNVPTRALDEFENGVLAKLWTDEDVVVKQDGDHYRMLGSLRAGKQCLDCHSAQRGELLGAFSYAIAQNVGK